LKIVMVGPFGLRIKGTVARRAWPLARALAARGHDVTLLIPPWDSPQDSGLAWTAGGVRVVHLVVPNFSSLPESGREGGKGDTGRSQKPLPALPLTCYHLRVSLDLAAAAWARRPDVVHLFKPKGHTGVVHLLLWFLRRCGVCRARLVVDSDDWEGPGGWNKVAGYSFAARGLFSWQERWGLRHADAVTAASRALAQRARALRQDDAVFYLPNGVGEGHRDPTSSLNPLPEREREGVWVGEGYRDSTTRLLWFTRFSECSPARGLRLFCRVREQVPQAQLLVAGKGLHGEEKELLSLAAALGLSEAVDYRGWVEARELPALFATAVAAMFPMDDTTLQRARCPARLADLLAAGIPVVSERVGEMTAYIEDGENGLLVRPGDEMAFAASLTRLLTDEGLRQRLREGARQRMAEEFSWMKLAEQAETAYRAAG